MENVTLHPDEWRVERCEKFGYPRSRMVPKEFNDAEASGEDTPYPTVYMLEYRDEDAEAAIAYAIEIHHPPYISSAEYWLTFVHENYPGGMAAFLKERCAP